MEHEVKSVSADMHVVDHKEGIIDAWVSTTNIVDHGKDNILPGAYAKTLQERVPKVCWAHDWARPIGKCLLAKELLPGHPNLSERHKKLGAGSLWTRSQLNLKTQAGRDALSWIEFWQEENPYDPDFKTASEWSVGYDCSGLEGKARRAYKDERTGVRYIKALSLFEYSPVAHGMAPLTGTVAIKDMPRPVRIIAQAAKMIENGSLSPLTNLSLEEMAGAVDLHEYKGGDIGGAYPDKAKNTSWISTGAGTVNKPDKTDASDPSYTDPDMVQQRASDVSNQEVPDDPNPSKLEAGVDGTTNPDEDSYDNGPGTVNTAVKPKDKPPDDAEGGGGRSDDTDSDYSTGSDDNTKVVRHTIGEWLLRLGVEGKDWSDWDAQNQQNQGPRQRQAQPGSQSQQSSTQSVVAPNPANEARQVSASGAVAQPASPAAPASDEKPDEGEKPDGGGGKEGEGGGIGEAIHGVFDTVREAYHEGREQGDRIAEKLSTNKSIQSISLGSHEVSAAMYRQFGKPSPTFVSIATKARRTAQTMDDDADNNDHPAQVGNTTDTDGYVNSDSGFRGDATSRVDSPEDVALNRGILDKRGIPDEDGREDASAMKTFQTKRDFEANVGGGVDRDKLSGSDFVFPKTRTFPIKIAGDVSDAVSSWGRYKGSESFDTFKSRLTALARRKGFTGSLPKEWTGKVYSTSIQTKAWVNREGSFEDTKADLQEAVDRMIDTVFPDLEVTSWIESTFPEKALVGLVHNGNPGDMTLEYWEVPYTIDNQDIVAIGQPKSLDVVAVALDAPKDLSKGVNFLTPETVASKALAQKNATRLWRRYSLLSNLGVDISAGHPGLTPDVLRMAPEGLSYIPTGNEPDFRSGQMDLAQPGGAEPNIPDNTATTTTGVSTDPGNVPATAFPAWLQGTWYADNAGNLTSHPVSGLDLSGVSSMGVGQRSAPLDPSLSVRFQPGNMDSPPMRGILGTTLDAGTLSLGSAQGLAETKGESAILRHRRLLDEFNARVPDADEPLSDATEDIQKAWQGILVKVSEAFTELKEGRVLSSRNRDAVTGAHAALGAAVDAHAKLAEAHSALQSLLEQAGVKPGWQEPQSAEAGRDEEGVPIEQATSPNGTGSPAKISQKSFSEQLAIFQELQAQAPQDLG